MSDTNQRSRRPLYKGRAKTALLNRAVGYLPHHLVEPLEPRQLLAGTDPIINEFLASNKTGITDNFNQTSDWIEIYNPTGAPVNLQGYHLSNDITLPAQWTFPNITIPTNSYLLVWATSRDLTDPAQPLHTNFKLDPNPGEYLALTRPDNSIVTEFNPTYPEQLEDTSYGLGSNGFYQYMTSETPLAANIDGAQGLVNDTKFSVDRGLFTSPFQLTITTTTAGATIRYTTNGTPPTASTGTVYSGPITIDHTTTLRAAAFKTGFISSDVDTQTYLFLNDVIKQPNLPISSLTSSGTVATVTTPVPHGFVPGNTVLIYGANQTQYNTPVNGAPFTIATVPTPTTFTYTIPAGAVTPATPAANNYLHIANPVGYAGSWGTYADGTPATADYEMDPELVNDANYSTRVIDALSSIPSLSLVLPITDFINNTNSPNGTGGIYSFPGAATCTIGCDADVPLKTVTAISRSGTVATATSIGHGYANGDRIWIQNANQAQFNGTFTIFGVTSNTFQYTVSNTAPASATGTIFAQKKNTPQLWERGASAEWINPDGSQGFQINAGLQIQGNASREPNKSGKHSFRLLFKAQYGASHLDYPIFGDDVYSTFDALILKAGFNNSWIHWDQTQRQRGTSISDRWASQTQLLMGDAAKHGRFVQLYINGIYWGLYDVMERPESDFAAQNFGGDADDYDTINNEDKLIDGNRLAWDQMFNLVNTTDLTQAANYNAIKPYLDMPSFIDYMLLNYYDGNLDWDDHNWYATRHSRQDGVPANIDGFHFYSYDSENILNNTTDNVTGINNDKRPTRLFQRLKVNAEFQMLLADRIHKLFFNNGALTPGVAAATYRQAMDEVDPAVIAESARWGDYRKDVNQKAPNYNGTSILYNRDGSWVTETNRVLNTYFPVRTGLVLNNQFRALGYYPNMDAPEYNQLGGNVSAGFALTMTNVSNGTVYYTLDGTDPRLPGGAVAPGVLTYSGPVTINSSARVLARVYNPITQVWSAITDFTFNVIPAPTLRITEMMYNPKKPVGSLLDDDEYQYIELQNTGPTQINLNGIILKGVGDFVFPNMTLNPGQRTLVVANQSAFESLYGVGKPIAGVFIGRLSHNGEKITLQTALGQIIEQFNYKDGWYGATDGNGYSLVAVDPSASNDVLSTQEGWRASTPINGAPGDADPGYNNNAIVFNEVLSNTVGDPFIEFKNNTNAAIDISGWYLTDDELNRTKYTLPPGSIVPANGNGYLTLFDSTSFGSAFHLSPAGGALNLANSYSGAQLGGYRDGVDYGPADLEKSFGRYIKSTGGSDFTALTSPTPNANNAAPLVGPVVINEVNYNPFNGGTEWIEFKNISGSTVALNDGTYGWAFTSGVSYIFGPGASLASGEIALLVPIDPTLFRTKYSIPAGVQIFGPFTGTLSNDGEKIAIGKPVPLSNPQAYIQVDRINYNDSGSWPIFANGMGSTLQRKVDGNYSNDAANWGPSALNGTPGIANAIKTAPVVNAGPDATINEGSFFSFNSGSFTDPDAGETWTATINWGDTGQPVALSLNANKTFVSQNHNYTDNGVYTVTVTVTDSGKLVGTDTVIVTVNNLIPNAITSAVANEGSAGTLTLSTRTDPSSTDTTVGWLANVDFDNDGIFELTNSTLTSFTIPASLLVEGPSTRTAKVRLIDKDGGFRDLPVTINVANVAPTAVINNSGPAPEGSTTTTVSLTNIVDSPGDIAAGMKFSYDFDNNNVFEITNSTSSSAIIPAQYLVDGPGSRTVHIRITDRDNGSRDYTTVVNITNVTPVFAPIADVTVGVDSGFGFNGTISDPGTSDTFTGTVDYGDGSGPQVLSFSLRGDFSLGHTYHAPGNYTVTVNASDKDGAAATPLTFTVHVRTPFLTGTPGADTWYIRAGTFVEFYEGNAAPPGQPTFRIPRTSINNITVDGQGGVDTLNIITDVNNALPPISFNGGSGTAATLNLSGNRGDINFLPSASSGSGIVNFNGTSFSYTGVGTLGAKTYNQVKLVTPNASDTLNLATAYPVTTVTGTSGALTLPTFVANDVVILDLDVAANDAGGGDDSVMVTKTGNFTPQRLYLEAGTGNNSITFDSGNQSLERVNYNLGTLDVIANHTASVQLALRGAPLRSLTINDSAIVSANLGPYRLSSLSIAPNAIFDLGVEDLILDTTPATRQSVFNAVESWIASGRNGGTSRWFGKGITAYPSTSTPRIVGLASMINEGPGGSPIFTTFDGQSVNTNSILVKYTYEGDVNFNGQIDPDDYAAIDAGFATRATGYIHGDFNRSGGPPNSDDYFTIDQAFSSQGAPLSAPAAPAPAVVESTSAAAPIAATPEAPASSALAVSTDSDSLKRTKHRHHKRAPKLDPVWSPRIPRSDALTRFLRRF